MGSFAWISTALITFYKKIELPVHTRIVEALESLEVASKSDKSYPTENGIREANDRRAALREPLSLSQCDSGCDSTSPEA